MLTFRDAHQVVDRIPEALRQSRYDALKEILNHVGSHRGRQALQCARGGLHNAPRSQEVPGQSEQLCWRGAFHRRLLQTLTQPLLSFGIEVAIPEILADTRCLGGLGCWPLRLGEEQDRGQPELLREIANGLNRHPLIIGNKTSRRP
jgi:hypothetical protein